MRIKKIWAVSAAALVMSGIMTGCSKNNDKTSDVVNVKIETTSQEVTTEVVTESAEPEKIAYTWYLEPSVKADDIIVYDIEKDYKNCNTKYQVVQECAYIQQNGLWGVIGYYGNFITESKYKNHTNYIGDYFCVYDDYNENLAVVHSGDDGLKVDKMTGGRGTLFESVYVDSETGELWFGGDAIRNGSCKFSEYTGNSVYTNNSVTEENYYNTGKCFVVREVTDSEYDANGNLIINPYNNGNVGNYGIANKDGVVVSCDYENGRYYRDYLCWTDVFSECCALKKNDKWAYFDSYGNQITDFIYDSCYYMEYYLNGDSDNVYLPTDGYIAVKNESGAGYCKTNGEEVIPAGTFEEARPVHNGKAWVKDKATGLWGVISVETSHKKGEVILEGTPDKADTSVNVQTDSKVNVQPSKKTTNTAEVKKIERTTKATKKTEKTETPTVEPFKVRTVEPESVKNAENWQIAYADILKKYIGSLKNPDYAKFSLCYVDDDVIPELIVHTGAALYSHADTEVFLYTFYNGKVYDFGQVCNDGYSTFSYYKNKCVVITGWMNQGLDARNVYTLSKGTLTYQHKYYSNKAAVATGGYSYFDGIISDNADDKFESCLPSVNITHDVQGEYSLTEKNIKKYLLDLIDDDEEETTEATTEEKTTEVTTEETTTEEVTEPETTTTEIITEIPEITTTTELIEVTEVVTDIPEQVENTELSDMDLS